MTEDALSKPALRVNSAFSLRTATTVSACHLDPDWVACLAARARPHESLKTIFRVTVAEQPSGQNDNLPDVSGRYLVSRDEIEFVPYFPFETGLKYCASFDPRSLGAPGARDLLMLEFLIPRDRSIPSWTEVTRVFPSSDFLPENLLRFYVCFSNCMQRGRAREEIALLDSDGRRVTDVLYRAPVELWDRSQRYLTVLLDPGRLKRWVGPNIRLGPPLKMGRRYTLEIGSGMIDVDGRPLRETFRKDFRVGEAIRRPISVEGWNLQPPVAGTRRPLLLNFPDALDWALLGRTILIESPNRPTMDGSVRIDQCERRWNFTPASPWTAGAYVVRLRSDLEDICGNRLTGAFERTVRKNLHPPEEGSTLSLAFQLT
jgi:hypothetical protein